MKVTKFETFLANAGLRNYLFVRLTTDAGITGVGEATLEWQEKTVETLLHEWVKDRVLDVDPFNVERIIGDLIRDQYQGGATIMTAISCIEIALWDIIGKACGQPVYKLLGGRCWDELPAYANGWYGGAHEPMEYAKQAREAVRRGYQALKFDPFDVSWKYMTRDETTAALARVAAVREAVGPEVQLMIEFHGRLAVDEAIRLIRLLESYQPAWCEEPVQPESIELLAEVKRSSSVPIAAGERLYTLTDFARLINQRAVDIVQMDIAHCGGILQSKKIAALAAAQDIRIAPHCSVGPVALAAALHVAVSTPNFMVQEAFAEFDVPWRNDLVNGWNPLRDGRFMINDQPGLGLELNETAFKQHPYKKNSFPSLWDRTWLTNFRQDEQ